MRLIDADALDCLSWEDGEHGTTFDDGVAWVCRLIDRQPTIEAQRTGKWIPCSERLPEEGCEFLCCDERGESIIGLPYADEEAYTGFSAESETEYIFNCVAWMPLPEPYQEGG